MPHATEVAPGVFQVKVPIPRNALGFTLTYLLKGPSGHILIDTGVPLTKARDVLLPALKEMMDPSDLETVLVTHSHRDHSGLVSEVKSWAPDATVVMHAADWKDMSQDHHGGQARFSPEHARRRFAKWLRINGFPPDLLEEAGNWGHRKKTKDGGELDDDQENPWAEDKDILPMQKPDVLVHGGERISNGKFTLDVLHTPGHSPGHICFYEADRRIMFTGDHVLPGITPNVSFRPGSGKSPLEDYLNSLARVEKYDVALVCPAHERIFDDLPKRVREMNQHHQARLDAALRGIREGARTAYQIAERIPWDVGTWDKMDVGLRRAALGEALSHLELLVVQGKVRETKGEDEVIRFELVDG